MYEDAQTFFQKTLKLGPNLIEAYYELGRAYWFGGDQDQAKRTWTTGSRRTSSIPGQEVSGHAGPRAPGTGATAHLGLVWLLLQSGPPVGVVVGRVTAVAWPGSKPSPSRSPRPWTARAVSRRRAAARPSHTRHSRSHPRHVRFAHGRSPAELERGRRVPGSRHGRTAVRPSERRSVDRPPTRARPFGAARTGAPTVATVVRGGVRGGGGRELGPLGRAAVELAGGARRTARFGRAGPDAPQRPAGRGDRLRAGDHGGAAARAVGRRAGAGAPHRSPDARCDARPGAASHLPSDGGDFEVRWQRDVASRYGWLGWASAVGLFWAALGLVLIWLVRCGAGAIGRAGRCSTKGGRCPKTTRQLLDDVGIAA